MQILCTELGGFGKLVSGINVAKLFHQLALLILFVVQLATTKKENFRKIHFQFGMGQFSFCLFRFGSLWISLSTQFRCFML